MNGLDVLGRIRRDGYAVPVLVITMHQDAALVRRAVRAGASGYAPQGHRPPRAAASIRAVTDGGSVVDPALLRAALDRPVAATGRAPTPLSRVELDLLRLVADGRTNPQIAASCAGAGPRSKKYVQRVLEKLEVADRHAGRRRGRAPRLARLIHL